MSTLASILSVLRQSGTSNAVIYASDPESASITYNDHGRVLALTSTNTTCDDICETVTGVYEGVLVVSYIDFVGNLCESCCMISFYVCGWQAITLLIILISGLCCMMGIDTPTRFETLQD